MSGGGSTVHPDVQDDAGSASADQVPSRPGLSQSSRLAASQVALRARGFSQGALERISAPQASSTLECYQGKWRVFVEFCESRKLDPLQATAPVIADFLLERFKKDTAPSTLVGYRSAIAGALKLSQGVDYGSDPSLSSLMRSFHRERPRAALRVPGWDLAFVLMSLTKPPFEPMSSDGMSLKLITLKTVFLTLLASGARRGELHSLSASIRRDGDWRWITLTPVPEFVSKTELRTSGATAFEGFTIKSLLSFVGPDLSDDTKLCPVRALKIYLARTKSMRGDKRRLFISFLPGKTTDISKNTVSSWVVQLVKLVYQQDNSEARTLAGVKAHDVRAFAASWASRGPFNLEALLQACSWRSHTTFTSFYLKDLSAVADQLYALGPLVVAQSVVQSR